MGARAIGGAGLLLLVLATGCRAVWVHPEATAAKYDRDLFFCRYGMERSEWTPPPGARPAPTRSDRAWALEQGALPKTVRREWKGCMVRLGWDTRTGARASAPWSTPRPPKRRKGQHY